MCDEHGLLGKLLRRHRSHSRDQGLKVHDRCWFHMLVPKSIGIIFNGVSTNVTRESELRWLVREVLWWSFVWDG